VEIKEEAGLKDTVGLEVTKGGEKITADERKKAAVAERDKALALAHDKYVEATEAARKEYVEAKNRINREFDEKIRG
jgi:hypothetical protein